MLAYVGCYTTPDRDGRGNGINVYRVDGLNWTHLQTVGGLENPSLFTLNRDASRLYSVHGGRSLVSAFRIDAATGLLTLLNQVDCQGVNPVDSALDPTQRFLVVANYGTGAVAVIPVGADGELLAVSQVVALPGAPGPDPVQQASSHPHAVIFDPSARFVIVPDKGLDRTFVFGFADGRLSEPSWVDSAAGAAPRHAVFHPDLPVLYVNNELDSTVTVFDWTAGQPAQRQVIGTRSIPAGANTTAEIAVSADGRYLYVSNRGEDNIARFVIDGASGTLRFADHVPTGGARPRFFAIAPDGQHLYAANQDSNTITMFAIDPERGALMPTGVSIGVGSPSAISFVPAR